MAKAAQASFELPPPICQQGYPHSQLVEIFGPEKIKTFFHWMRGQTFSECDGQRYVHETKSYEPTGCGPHGFVYYSWDVQRFLDGRPIID
jgi:hypothetical protein